MSVLGPGSAVKCVRTYLHPELLGRVFFVREVIPSSRLDSCNFCEEPCHGLLFLDLFDPPPISEWGGRQYYTAGWAGCCFEPYDGPEDAKREREVETADG